MTLHTLRTVLAMGLILLLASCYPSFNLSVYNSSGQSLRVLTLSGQIDWAQDQYFSMRNHGSDAISEDYSHLKFEVLSSDGLIYTYLLDKNNSDYYFRYIAPGTAVRKSSSPVVSANAQRACIHMRIDNDMSLYWMSGDCSKRNLNDLPAPDQPQGFPIRPDCIGPNGEVCLI